MAKFTFQLQGVLQHRERLEREKQREFALAQAERVRIQNELKMLDESVQRATDDLRRNHLTGKIDLSFLTAHRRFILSTQRRGVALIETLNTAQKAVDTARHALAEAAKQKKILEKLKERQYQRWVEEQARKEASQFDEMTTQMTYLHSQETT